MLLAAPDCMAEPRRGLSVAVAPDQGRKGSHLHNLLLESSLQVWTAGDCARVLG